MIKKIFMGMAISATLLASCSSEEPAGGNSGGNVTFTATLPGDLQTRAYGDGTTATELKYVVYNADGEEISHFTNSVPMSNLKATVNLNLVADQTYTIVFWAQAPDAPYTLDSANGTITVTPTGPAQSENRDAFFASETFTVKGVTTRKVELKRPFAQINIGTTDMADFLASKGTLTKSGLKVTAPSVLNLKDGSVSVDAQYDLENADIPAEVFPMTLEGKTLTYLAANYILVGNSKETVDITWTSDHSVASKQSVVYTGVPVQRNYRTNIYGNLLTESNVFNVQITPNFNEPAFEGLKVTTPEGLLNAINSGIDVEIPAGTEIELAQPLTLSDGQTLEINGTLSAPTNVITVPAGASASVRGAGKINFTYEGDGVAEGNTYAVNAIEVYGKLELADVKMESDNHLAGSMIYLRENSETVLENVVVNTGFRAVTSAAGSKVTINGGEYHSTSANFYKNSAGKSAYAYCVVLSGAGTEAVLNNVVVTGIQGAFSVSRDSKAVLNNCDCSTADAEGKPGSAFYAVYTAQGSDVTINSGKYYSPRVAVYSGNNDRPGDTFGSMRLYGGVYSHKPSWSQANQSDYPLPAGYVWTSNDDDRYPWTIVKE